jgi:hypothetical protein
MPGNYEFKYDTGVDLSAYGIEGHTLEHAGTQYEVDPYDVMCRMLEPLHETSGRYNTPFSDNDNWHHTVYLIPSENMRLYMLRLGIGAIVGIYSGSHDDGDYDNFAVVPLSNMPDRNVDFSYWLQHATDRGDDADLVTLRWMEVPHKSGTCATIPLANMLLTKMNSALYNYFGGFASHPGVDGKVWFNIYGEAGIDGDESVMTTEYFCSTISF